MREEMGPDARDEPTTPQERGEAADVQAQLEQVQQEAEELRNKVDVYLDLAQRTQADFVNYKRRIERERESDTESARAAMLRTLLPIFDDLDRAVERMPDGEDDSWTEGVRLIHRKVQRWLDTHSVRRIDKTGEPFDPALHEAVAYEERPGFGEGQVASVMRPGYAMGERVLRPAQVTVARASKAPGQPSHSRPSQAATSSHEHSSTRQTGGD